MDQLSRYLREASQAVNEATESIKQNPQQDLSFVAPAVATMLQILKDMRNYDIRNSGKSGIALAHKWGITTGRVSQIRNGK